MWLRIVSSTLSKLFNARVKFTKSHQISARTQIPKPVVTHVNTLKVCLLNLRVAKLRVTAQEARSVSASPISCSGCNSLVCGLMKRV